ncbi:hypothetical protein [Streptomyces chartreusis]|uniref:hypothetical protein n=1 Tax=Streptomyces chartreusis TaxID=1969 RepID=UPI0037F27515
MSAPHSEEAMAQALAALGVPAMTSETWSQQAALDALREQRRRNPGDARGAALDELAVTLADRLQAYTDVSPAVGATVLLVAGASVGSLALLHGLPGVAVSEILQATAVELDKRAQGGETS